jgi:hypothetical protein
MKLFGHKLLLIHSNNGTRVKNIYLSTQLDLLGHRLDVVRSMKPSLSSQWAMSYWGQVEKQLVRKIKILAFEL